MGTLRESLFLASSSGGLQSRWLPNAHPSPRTIKHRVQSRLQSATRHRNPAQRQRLIEGTSQKATACSTSSIPDQTSLLMLSCHFAAWPSTLTYDPFFTGQLAAQMTPNLLCNAYTAALKDVPHEMGRSHHLGIGRPPRADLHTVPLLRCRCLVPVN